MLHNFNVNEDGYSLSKFIHFAQMNPKTFIKLNFILDVMTVILKLRTTGKKITPFLSTVQKSGSAQEKFKENWGIPMGACVKQHVKKGMSIVEIHDAVRACAKSLKSGMAQKTVKTEK